MPLKQLKQIIQIKHNIVKNPNWPEADQLAIYKCGRGFELGRSVKQIQLVARAGLEPGTAGLRVRRADHSATLPPSFKRLGQLSTTGNPKRKISIARIYCTVVVTCFWFSFVMSIVSLCVEGSSVLQNVYTLITFSMWYFVSAIVATTCLFVLPLNEGKKSRFEKFV